jgi:hypothetical protein
MTTEPAVCASPHCENPVPTRSGPGRPFLYCSPACRPRPAAKRRARVEVFLEHEPTVNGERPVGRVWSVELRCGDDHVVLVSELGRPSAENLVAGISELLNPHSKTQGGANY